jgi:alkylation response protein AidB-like acyl-CoA dehydrogenase
VDVVDPKRKREGDAANPLGDLQHRAIQSRISHRKLRRVPDFALSREQELVRSSAREFAGREISPHAREWDRAETMDRAIVGKLAEVGFLGAGLPDEYGGLSLDTVSYCLLMEELGRADSSVRGIVSVNVGLVGKTIAKWGTEGQKSEWLPALCSGKGLGCYALTEPGSGSDPASLSTRAERDGDEWVLSGSKLFITLGSWASLALVFARTGVDGAGGITCFAVPTGSAGFRAQPIKGKLGLRAQDTAELFLEGVRVPDANRLGDEGDGFKVAMSALDNGRISLAAGCVGIAEGCLAASIAYARERTQFGKPVASFQLVQELIADIAVETEAARLLVWRAASLADRGEPHTLESSVAKYYASEVSVRAANAAVQVHGGYGYVDEYPVGKYLRDARVTTLYEGTSQIQKLIIGRALTGESAFV